MALLFHKDFSDALTGANGFDSVGVSNGTIVQSAGAGLNSTSGGVTITATAASPNVYGLVSESFVGKTLLRTAFYTDLSGLAIGTNGHGIVLLRFDITIACLLVVIRVSGELKFRHYLYNDSGGFTFNEIALNDLDWMELRIQRASDGSTADANSQVYFGGGSYAATGELVSELTGILCYTRFEQTRFIMGMFAQFSTMSVSGSLLCDEWTVRDDDEPILVGVGAEVDEAFKGGGGGSKASLSQYVQIG